MVELSRRGTVTGVELSETSVALARARGCGEVLEGSILEDPEDRAAHAALADLLMERGDPRGKFIQVQLALEETNLTAGQRKIAAAGVSIVEAKPWTS